MIGQLRPLAIGIALAALGGCAASYTESPLPADHPANAAEASVPNGMWNPTASPAVAEPARKVRRFMLGM